MKRVFLFLRIVLIGSLLLAVLTNDLSAQSTKVVRRDTLSRADTAPKRLRLDGGYVDLASGNSARRYFVRDHLGSVRAVVNDAGTVLETDDYYPLGGPLPTGSNTALQPEKYQGKDWNTAASFNVYDFGARLYDPALGRWLSQDPMAEKYYLHSPYLFCAGNPILFIDPNGSATSLSTDVKLNIDGSYSVVGAYDDGDHGIYVVGDDGNRTGEIIGTTLCPTDFMLTNDSTGAFEGHANVSFDLNSLIVSGSVRPNEHTTSSILGADAQRLLDWGQDLFSNEVMRQSPATFYGQLRILRKMSANDASLDFKSSLGLNKYTAIRAGISSDGKPVITTLRAVGNITFGANMRSTKPKLLGSVDWYYGWVMKKVGEYNQKQNNGNGYNAGFPFYGEHSYSGTYILWLFWLLLSIV